MKKPNRVNFTTSLHKMTNNLGDLDENVNLLYRFTFDILTNRVRDKTSLTRERL